MMHLALSLGMLTNTGLAFFHLAAMVSMLLLVRAHIYQDIESQILLNVQEFFHSLMINQIICVDH